jgi:hypothetical protein
MISNFNTRFKLFVSEYAGVLLGAAYGLGLRLVFNLPGSNFSFTDLFSITFVWIVPFVIGMVPMFFASERQLSKSGYRIFTPCLTVLLFFLFCFTSRAEDFICILIISAPFLLAAMIGGSIIGILLLKYRQNKNTLYSVLLIPFICGMIEEQFKMPTGTYHVNTVTIINATPQNIWQHVVRVDQINITEYHKGFFNYAGIPQPLYAELNKDTIGATRIGHFEGGLKFIETVNHWERNKKVSFNIAVLPSTIRNTIFDKHILMGNHFKFIDASYTLKKINNNQTELCLSSSYKLDTRVNQYATLWGDALLSDFQERLLAVIKLRCEQKAGN